MNFIELGIQQLHFSVGTWDLTYSFCTETSASFAVKMGGLHGWIDVHFPCQGHIKVHIRGALPAERLDAAKIQELISELRRHLKIPPKETYEAYFFKPVNVVATVQPVDREGKSDRIGTTTTWKVPD